MLIPRTMLRSHLKGSNMSASSLRLTNATWLLSMDCKVEEWRGKLVRIRVEGRGRGRGGGRERQERRGWEKERREKHNRRIRRGRKERERVRAREERVLM